MEDKKLWFKRKKYGYGWTPVTWEGWFAVIVYLCLIGSSTFAYFSYMERINGVLELPISIVLLCYLLVILFFSLLMIYVAHKKGEKPKWQWGN